MATSPHDILALSRALDRVMGAVIHDCFEADAKFGPHLDLPDLDQVLLYRRGGCDPTRMAENYEIPSEGRAKGNTSIRTERGELTWADVLVEEVSEAVCSASTAELRAELLQVAAVALRWVRAIDLREGKPVPPPPALLDRLSRVDHPRPLGERN